MNEEDHDRDKDIPEKPRLSVWLAVNGIEQVTVETKTASGIKQEKVAYRRTIPDINQEDETIPK